MAFYNYNQPNYSGMNYGYNSNYQQTVQPQIQPVPQNVNKIYVTSFLDKN